MSKTTNHKKIKGIVDLYRLLGKPTLVEDAYLICNLSEASQEVIQLVIRLQGDFTEAVECFRLNGVDQDQTCDAKKLEGKPFELIFRLPIGYFYPNLESFIETSTQLSMGILRDNFYLIDEDYYPGDDKKPDLITQLEKICAWIRFLQIVLHHTETRTNWLTFILFPETIDKNIRSKKSFRSKISISDLSCDLTKTAEFLEIAKKEDLHASERKSVFRQALAELLEHQIDEAQAFSYILQNIDKLYRTYHDNYERYINGFSIEKLKKEVIDDYNNFSTQINNSLNDIVTKAFAVPASLAAAALLIRLDNLASHVVMALVVLITTIIYVLTLSWQLNKIESIKNDISDTFSAFSNSGASGSSFAREKEDVLKLNADSVKRRVMALLILSLLPILVVVVYLSWKYT